MQNNLYKLIEKLDIFHSLSVEEYEQLILERNSDFQQEIAALARKRAEENYGNRIFIRGLVEISNICKNNCIYCGIRRDNKNCERYRLSADEILSCAEEGYNLGFRTIVMQGGEDAFFTDEYLCSVIEEIKRRYPDCAVTLSLGERSYESYQKLFNAGADRYLLRHETADIEHYKKLHPKEMSYINRMKCLKELKDIGYQAGCGFMVGSPYQTAHNLAEDLKFIEEFSPQMCGIGPFIPHKDTPFKEYEHGSAELTCYLLSILRIMIPNLLLPSTTALSTISPDGRERGILSGANVIMPNLSPSDARRKYTLYNNKLSSGQEAAENLSDLKKRMSAIGYEIVTERGDFKNNK